MGLLSQRGRLLCGCMRGCIEVQGRVTRQHEESMQPFLLAAATRLWQTHASRHAAAWLHVTLHAGHASNERHHEPYTASQEQQQSSPARQTCRRRTRQSRPAGAPKSCPELHGGGPRRRSVSQSVSHAFTMGGCLGASWAQLAQRRHGSRKRPGMPGRSRCFTASAPSCSTRPAAAATCTLWMHRPPHQTQHCRSTAHCRRCGRRAPAHWEGTRLPVVCRYWLAAGRHTKAERWGESIHSDRWLPKLMSAAAQKAVPTWRSASTACTAAAAWGAKPSLLHMGQAAPKVGLVVGSQLAPTWQERPQQGSPSAQALCCAAGPAASRLQHKRSAEKLARQPATGNRLAQEAHGACSSRPPLTGAAQRSPGRRRSTGAR